MQRWTELLAKITAIMDRLSATHALNLAPCLAHSGVPDGGVVRRVTRETPFLSIEWYVMNEVRSNSGPRDSMPRDFYPSGSGGSYTRPRTKVELALVLAPRGALVFAGLGLLCWGAGWSLFKVFGLEYDLIACGALGGASVGGIGGVLAGIRSSNNRFISGLMMSLVLGLLLAALGSILGVITSAFGAWAAWPVGGAVIGTLIGATVGFWKGA